MISNKGSVREKLKQLGGYDGHVDPVDWLMGSDVGVLKIGAKQGVAKQLFLLRRLQGGGGGGGGAQRRHKAPSAPLSPRLFSGGQQAVVKLVRNGGTQTARGLKAQITYLSREGEVDVERSERFFGTVIDEDGQNRLAASWGLDEPNETGVDKTSHFVVSFPIGTDREAAALAGRAWAEELFDSGKYGDVYDYYTVSHNDTEHPHVHVIVNRRGVEEGAWLKISKRGPIDYQKLRDVQVEAAREHGIHLEATPRTARGETDRPYTDVEVKRADREQRSPTRPNHTEQSASKTAISVLDHAAKINAEAEVLKKDLPEISQSLKSIADGLKKGISIQKVLHSEKVVDLGAVSYTHLTLPTILLV